MLRMREVGPYGQKLLGKTQEKGSKNAAGVGKRKWRTVSSQLASNNIYSVLRPEKLGNKSNSINTTERCTVHTMAVKGSLVESRIRKAGKSRGGSSESTIG